ncbi:MAG: hypothetical protein ACK5IQ_11800 [Bacteroidales bacterium]
MDIAPLQASSKHVCPLDSTDADLSGNDDNVRELNVCQYSEAVFNSVWTVGDGLKPSHWEYSADAGEGTWVKVKIQFINQQIKGSETDGQTLNIFKIPTNDVYDGFFRAVYDIPSGGMHFDKYRVRVFPPVIGSISPSDTSFCSGEKIKLSLSAYDGRIIRWESSSDRFISKITEIPHTDSVYNTRVLTDTTYYRALVSNGICDSVYSKVSAVNVSPITTSGTLSSENTNLCTGDGAKLELKGFVGRIVRWESSSDNFVNNISEITRTEPVYSPIALRNTIYYRVVVVSGKCDEVYSNTLIINVSQKSRGGYISPPDTSICSGNSVKLELNNFLGKVIRWESSSDNFASKITEIPHADSVYNSGALTKTTYYRAVVKNGACGAEFSKVSVVKVSPATASGKLSPAETTICVGDGVKLELKDFVGKIIRWERSTDNFVNNISEVARTNSVYDLINMKSTTYYRVLVNSGVCGETYSNIVVVNVVPTSKGGSISPSDTSICSNNKVKLKLNGFVGKIVGWESSSDNFAKDVKKIIHTDSVFSTDALTRSTRYRVLIKSGICEPQYSDVAFIKVAPATASGVLSPAETKICEGGGVKLTLKGFVGNIARWERSTDNFSKDISEIVRTDSVYELAAMKQTTYYRVLVSSGVCGETYSNTVDVHVAPKSKGGNVSPSDTSVCAGAKVIMRLNNFVGRVVRWESSSDNFKSEITEISLADSVCKPGALSKTVFYRALVSNGVCSPVYSDVNVIRVSPKAASGVLSTAKTKLCAGETVKLELKGFAGDIIRWESSTDNFKSEIKEIKHSDAAYDIKTRSSETSEATTFYRVLVGSGVCGEVYSNTIAIDVSPQTKGGSISPADVSICAGEKVKLSLNDFRGEIIRWESSEDNFASKITEIANTEPTYSPKILNKTLYYRALIKSGHCNKEYSKVGLIKVSPKTASGTLSPAKTNLCAGDDVKLELNNFVGNIVRWESSTDDFENDIKDISHTASVYIPTNPSETAYYRVVIASGVCGEVYSNAVLVKVSPKSVGGYVSASETDVCAGGKVELTLNDFVGEIVRWESSTDDFAGKITEIPYKKPVCNPGALSETTYFRVLLKSGICDKVYSKTIKIEVKNCD